MHRADIPTVNCAGCAACAGIQTSTEYSKGLSGHAATAPGRRYRSDARGPHFSAVRVVGRPRAYASATRVPYVWRESSLPGRSSRKAADGIHSPGTVSDLSGDQLVSRRGHDRRRRQWRRAPAPHDLDGRSLGCRRRPLDVRAVRLSTCGRQRPRHRAEHPGDLQPGLSTRYFGLTRYCRSTYRTIAARRSALSGHAGWVTRT